MTIKITKQLATMEDLAIGTGTVIQERNGVPLTLNKINFTAIVSSVAKMQERQAIVGTTIQTLGYYSAGDGGGAYYTVEKGDSSNGTYKILISGNNTAVLQTVKGFTVKQCGAVGDGSTNDRAAIAGAINALNSVGGQLTVEPGHYFSEYLTHTIEANWMAITRSNVSIVSTGATFENMLFYIKGTYGDLKLVGSEGFTSGDKIVNTASAHGLVEGNYIQLLSSVNAGSTDAGEFQMEAMNAVSLVEGNLRLSEIHKVFRVESATEVTIYDSVIYPDYKDNVLGYAFAIPDLVGAEIRKLNVVENILFKGITFRNMLTGSFRELIARAAVNLSFEKCSFEAGTLPGTHFKCTDTKGLYFTECTSYRNPESITGSSWNSFIIGGGSQDLWVDGGSYHGENQTFDYTPILLVGDPGTTDVVSPQLSVQNITIRGAHFYDCNNGFTTHPGCYNLIASDNTILDCESGMTIRSLRNNVTGNLISALSSGFSLSGFYGESLFADNVISDVLASTFWQGIKFAPSASELFNNNNIKNVVVKGNTLIGRFATTRQGLLIRHFGNGVPPAGYTRFTDAVKTALSDYTIEGNTYDNCTLQINRYVSGVKILGNIFKNADGIDVTEYLNLGFYASAAFVDGNIFEDDNATALTVDLLSPLAYPFEKRNSIGEQKSKVPIVNSIVQDNVIPVKAYIYTGDLSFGEWLPVITPIENIASSSITEFYYTINGQVITFGGQMFIEPTVGDAKIQLQFTLPVLSSFSGSNDLAGVAVSVTDATLGQTMGLSSSFSGGKANLAGKPALSNNTIYNISGCYRLL